MHPLGQVIGSHSDLEALQTHASLKADRDRLNEQLKTHSDQGAGLKAQLDTLQGEHSSLQTQLAAVSNERTSLLEEKSGLQSQVDAAQRALSALQQQHSQAASELGASTRQLQNVQAELRQAVRRAEESEQTQQDLQAEGTRLMQSLEEMRPKVVTLTNEKLELSDRAEALESALHKRDVVIAELESSVHELNEIKEELKQRHHEVDSQLTREQESAHHDLSSLQAAYAELQRELEDSRTGMRALEGERATRMRSGTQQVEDIDRLTASLRHTKQQLSSLQMEVDERRQAEAEQREFLDRAMTDIESLRGDLVARDEEVDRLHQALSGLSTHGAPESLNEEMLSAYHQQHEFELSSAQSHIRALEARVYDADAKAHSLQLHLNALEDELAQLRTAPQPSPQKAAPSRPASRAHGDDLRRATMTRRSGLATAPARTSLDYSLSPETRHKRRISLNMLKARMDSERAAAAAHAPPSRAATPAPRVHGSRMPAVAESEAHGGAPVKRSHFLDESNIFWCHTCRGDLVIL